MWEECWPHSAFSSPPPPLPVLLALLSPFFSLAPHLWGVVWVLYCCGSDPQRQVCQVCQGSVPPSFTPHSTTLFSSASISHLHTWCRSLTRMSCKEICNVGQLKWLESWKHHATISRIFSWLYTHGWFDKHSLRSSLKIQSFLNTVQMFFASFFPSSINVHIFPNFSLLSSKISVCVCIYMHM